MKKALSENRELSTQEGRRAYWREHIEKWQQSGQSKQAYCREHSLKTANLYRWCAKLLKGEQRRPQFIPVRLPTLSANRYGLELMLVNGRVLRMGDDVDPVWVSQLVQELERAC